MIDRREETGKTTDETFMLAELVIAIRPTCQGKILGFLFDSRLIWGDHVRKMEGICKRVVHVMRCVAGWDWGSMQCKK